MDFGQGIRKALAKITGAAIIDEAAVKELVKELQRVLITNDVDVKLVREITKKIESKAIEEKKQQNIAVREHIAKIVYDELVSLLGEKFEPKIEKNQRILMCGLFGVGKTTTISKLAKFYQKKGLHVGVICGDVHRPAAFEQLKQLSEQVKCDFYGNKNQSAELTAVEGLDKLKHCDVIIYDSAGRSAFDQQLAHELKIVVEKFRPTDSFLVVSADIGQVAGRQAEEFSKAAPISGVIITKMDGSGKGGGALSSVKASNSKVAFIGTGEKPDALEVFDSKKFVSNLCGFPDLESLLDKVKEAGDEAAIQRVMESGKLDYEAFLAQMRAMKKMGPLKQVMQMIGVYDIPEEMMVKSEEKLKVFENAVNSMTREERQNPELMNNKARQQRIAKGAGINPEDVRELVKQFNLISKFMGGAKKNRLLKRLSDKMPFDLSKLGVG
ncbi:signal recognition particle receptor subunit alpha [Candidatus Micrarchaeota archaeon]|nr:signal recognition particle receptor subunit alpha [Candidatus Micrarchaeota archaeon]